MSHIVRIKTRVRDRDVLKLACQKNGIEFHIAAKGESIKRNVYSREVSGFASVTLPGWKYPVVFKESGDAVYDNSEGMWGDISHLNGLLVSCAEEVAHLEMKRRGYSLLESSINPVTGEIDLIYETSEADNVVYA